MAGIAFSLDHVRIGVRVNQREALDRALGTLPAGWRADPEPVVDRLYSIVIGRPTGLAHARPFHILYADDARLVRTVESSDAVFDALASDLRAFLARTAKGRS